MGKLTPPRAQGACFSAIDGMTEKHLYNRIGEIVTGQNLEGPRLPKHRIDYDELARCVCGAEIVWFEGAGSDNLCHGYGCSDLGWPTRVFRDYRED